MATWLKIQKSITDVYKDAQVLAEGQALTFTVPVDLENFERTQGLMITHKEFVGLDIITIDSSFGTVNDVSYEELTSHPSVQQQPFGIFKADNHWFVTNTLPLAHLNEDDLFAMIFKVAWIGDVLEQIHVGGDNY